MSKEVSQLNSPCFTRDNLALLLGGARRTLDYRISGLVAKGEIVVIKPGFYINTQKVANDQSALESVSGVLVSPSYISLEYAMSRYGLIAESAFGITCVTTKKPRKFISGGYSYIYRKIKPAMFFGYQTIGESYIKYNLAYLYKALVDYIYLTPLGSAEAVNGLVLESRFNWDVFTSNDWLEFERCTLLLDSRKLAQVLKVLKKEGIYVPAGQN